MCLLTTCFVPQVLYQGSWAGSRIYKYYTATPISSMVSGWGRFIEGDRIGITLDTNITIIICVHCSDWKSMPVPKIISILIMPMLVPVASCLPHLASSVEATRSFLATWYLYLYMALNRLVDFIAYMYLFLLCFTHAGLSYIVLYYLVYFVGIWRRNIYI